MDHIGLVLRPWNKEMVESFCKMLEEMSRLTSQPARQSIALTSAIFELTFESKFSHRARHMTIGSQLKPLVCPRTSRTITGWPFPQCLRNCNSSSSFRASFEFGQYKWLSPVPSLEAALRDIFLPLSKVLGPGLEIVWSTSNFLNISSALGHQV